MQELIENANSITLTILTFVLAFFTGLLWLETKRTRLKNITPQISVSFYPQTAMVMGLKIENTSQVDAKEVITTCLNKNRYSDSQGREFFYSEKLSKRISYLPAGQKYLFIVGYYKVMENEIFEFDISHSDMSGEKKTQFRIEINMEQLNQILVEASSEKEIAKNIKELSKNIMSLMEGGFSERGLRVYPYSVEERKIKQLEEAVDFYRECSEENSLKSKD